MNILILSTSPRKSFSTSHYLSRIIKLWLGGNQVEILPLKSEADYQRVLEKLPHADALVFATPVYVDTIPSTVLHYLKKLEGQLAGQHCSFSVYAITNCGFYEGHQCELALNTVKLWCERANLKWCGGIGIGSGVMLGFVRILPFIALAATLLELVLRGITQAVDGHFTVAGLFAGWVPINFIVQTVLWVLFTMGAFLGLLRLKTAITKKKEFGMQFTTVWFCPRFLFVWMASLYWLLRALLLHGTMPWKLWQKPNETEL